MTHLKILFTGLAILLSIILFAQTNNDSKSSSNNYDDPTLKKTLKSGNFTYTLAGSDELTGTYSRVHEAFGRRMDFNLTLNSDGTGFLKYTLSSPSRPIDKNVSIRWGSILNPDGSLDIVSEASQKKYHILITPDSDAQLPWYDKDYTDDWIVVESGSAYLDMKGGDSHAKKIGDN